MRPDSGYRGRAMEPEQVAQNLLITVSGRDRPGLTAQIFAALEGEVLDTEQSVVSGRLVQLVLLSSTEARQLIEQNLTQLASELELDIEVAATTQVSYDRDQARQRLVMLGAPLDSHAIAKMAQAVRDAGGNIERMSRIAAYPVTAIELIIQAPDNETLRKEAAAVASEWGIDFSVQPISLDRLGRHLVVLDVDSTLIQDEVIELLAQHTGTETEVAEITERAMRGELDFRASLYERAALLAGAKETVLAEVRDQIRLTPGARTLCRTLTGLGHEVALVSGGFTEVIAPIAAQLGVGHVRANTLEIQRGRLTGRVLEPVVDRSGKAAALREIAAETGIPLTRTVAIGDGANDLDMLAAAGLGVAFNAKPVLRDAADAAVNVPFLDSVLFLMGLSREEIESAQEIPTR